MKLLKIITVAISVTLFIAATPLSTDIEKSDASHHDIVSIASDADNLSTLVTAVQAAGLVETLQSEGPFTVFAPTNEAFAALPDGTLESLLLEENRDKLIQILTYHVVPGKVMSTDLEDGMMAETVEGSSITVDLDGGVSIDNANVVTADIEADNGVVHIIDAVIMPSEEESSSY
ncbi:MAG: fasciclin domain-containing protein [Balneolaceae bacterium]|nr:fasciclin domain-containing protein [Balneolaceae bacterium]MDR9409336.1 fasciclin domain-containing protein [Balneolaceae bacterium]